MPLHRRLPKRGFTNIFKTDYAVVNVSDLERFDNGASVDEAMLRQAGLVKGSHDGVKVLGDGELSKKLTVSATKFSETAKQSIEAAGPIALSPPSERFHWITAPRSETRISSTGRPGSASFRFA